MKLSMDFYQYTLNISYIIISSLYIFSLLRNKFHFSLFVFLAAVPLKHVYITIFGHYLELWKLLSLMTLPVTLNYFVDYFSKYRLLRIIYSYFFVSFLSSFLGIFVSNCIGNNVALNIDLRTIFTQQIQLISFLNLILIPIVLSRNNYDVIIKSIKIYILSLFALSILGMLQFVVFYFFGENIFPIPRMTGEFQEEVFLNYMGGERVDALFRVTSLSMEPKNLAAYLATGVIFLVELRQSLRRPAFGPTLDIVSLLSMLVCLIMTYSTLGFGIIAIYLSVKIIFIKKNYFILTLFIPLLPLLFTDIGRHVIDIVNDRLYYRVVNFGFMEDFDLATWDFLVDNPIFILTGMGYGNTHIMAVDYLPFFAEWASGGRWHAKMGLLYVLSATGVIGVLFFGTLILVAFRYAKKSTLSPMNGFNQNTLTTFSLLYFFRHTEMTFIVVGIVFSIYATNEIKINKSNRQLHKKIGCIHV